MPKKSAQPTTSPIALSVVIPAYNAASWLPKSVPKVAQAIKRAGISDAEIIIVDDGSSDNTTEVAKSLKLPYPVQAITQANAGRFQARDTGAQIAKYEFILFIDTRVFIGEDCLKYVVDRLRTEPERVVWTSHVISDNRGNIYARFWDAITYVAWRRYFSNPRDYSFGLDEFDYYPKATTSFFVPRDVILEANKWFKKSTKAAKATNDDTLLIRRIAEKNNINISPDFFCTYHARTSFSQHIKHTFHRGKVFVDGFLRRDGNRYFWPLILFLVLSLAVPIFLILSPQYIVFGAIIAIALWLLELVIALLLGVPTKDALSLFILTPPFVVCYGLGIWTAIFNIYVRRERAA